MRESYVDFVRERVASPLFSNEKQRDFFFFPWWEAREREGGEEREREEREKKSFFIQSVDYFKREKCLELL